MNFVAVSAITGSRICYAFLSLFIGGYCRSLSVNFVSIWRALRRTGRV